MCKVKTDFEELLNRYAEVQGAKYVEDNERLKCDPNFVYPEGLDEKCFAAIDAALEERTHQSAKHPKYAL